MTQVSEQQGEEIGELKARVAALEAQVARLEGDSTEKVLVLREITRDEARAEIAELFRGGETLYYSDISDRLRIDLEMVVEICRELLEEGAIGVDDDAE